MIARLQGTVVELNRRSLILDVQGVGYQLECSLAAVEALSIGEEATLIVYTDVKQDNITLYGFADQLEKQVFLLLLQVKGVGARSASEILSRVEKRALLRFIGGGNAHELQQVKGIGKKTAERIIVELKDKVTEYVADVSSSPLHIEREVMGPFEDALQALQSLGFSKQDAQNALDHVRQQKNELNDAGDIVKEALRFV